MNPNRFSLRAPLALALLAALAACSQTAPDAATPAAERAEPVQTTENAGEIEAPEAVPAAGPTAEQQARMDAILVTLQAEPMSEPLPVTQRGEESVATIKAGETFHVCIQNQGDTNALMAISVQGKNIDLSPAHTHRPLWQLTAKTTRCLPAFIVADADSAQPPIVAWTVFLADGEDGSSIQDETFPPAISSHLWLGQAGTFEPAVAWPATAPAPETPDTPAADQNAPAVPETPAS